MNDPLTYEEFNISIGTLILHKVLGIDGIFQNAKKALDVRNRKYLFDICSEYFNGDMDIPEWQMGSCNILPKKGDLYNQNNWRDINLLDAISKITFLVITSRLQLVLDKIGTPLQFGASPQTGCSKGFLSPSVPYYK